MFVNVNTLVRGHSVIGSVLQSTNNTTADQSNNVVILYRVEAYLLRDSNAENRCLSTAFL